MTLTCVNCKELFLDRAHIRCIVAFLFCDNNMEVLHEAPGGYVSVEEYSQQTPESLSTPVLHFSCKQAQFHCTHALGPLDGAQPADVFITSEYGTFAKMDLTNIDIVNSFCSSQAKRVSLFHTRISLFMHCSHLPRLTSLSIDASTFN